MPDSPNSEVVLRLSREEARSVIAWTIGSAPRDYPAEVVVGRNLDRVLRKLRAALSASPGDQPRLREAAERVLNEAQPWERNFILHTDALHELSQALSASPGERKWGRCDGWAEVVRQAERPEGEGWVELDPDFPAPTPSEDADG
jgi:hypothetical protein